MLRASRHTRGFTLIEVSIVIAIMMILLAISAPRLRQFAASSKLKSSAKAIRSLLTYARDIAVTEHEGYLVVFDLDTQEYWLVASSEFDPEDPRAILTEGVDPRLSASAETDETTSTTNSTSSAASEGEIRPSRTTQIVKIPQRPAVQVRLAMLQIDHGNTTMPEPITEGIDFIYFSPQGTAEDMELYLLDTRGRAVKLDVSGTTGRAQITLLSEAEVAELGLAPEESQ